ncbi:MAG: hypothetical protein QXL22_04955 [Candidatus Nezhaarchaeales archaeon]
MRMMKLRLKLKKAQRIEEREMLLLDVGARVEELFGINCRDSCVKEDEKRLGRAGD